MKPLILIFALALCLPAFAQEDKVAALEARVAKLEAIVKTLTEKPAEPKSANTYGIPDKVYARIKKDAENQFPDNFTMQTMIIAAEAKSYRQLHKIKDSE